MLLDCGRNQSLRRPNGKIKSWNQTQNPRHEVNVLSCVPPCCLPLLCKVFSFRYDWFVCRHAPPSRPTRGAESTTITTVGECQECCQASARTFSLSGGVTFPFCHPFAEKDILASSPASPIVVQIYSFGFVFFSSNCYTFHYCLPVSHTVCV